MPGGGLARAIARPCEAGAAALRAGWASWNGPEPGSARGPGQPKRRMLGPQLKWAHDWHPMWSRGRPGLERQPPVAGRDRHAAFPRPAMAGPAHPGGQIRCGRSRFSQGAARAPAARSWPALAWPSRPSGTAGAPPPSGSTTAWRPWVRVGLRHQFDAHWSLDLGRAQIRREGAPLDRRPQWRGIASRPAASGAWFAPRPASWMPGVPPREARRSASRCSVQRPSYSVSPSTARPAPVRTRAWPARARMPQAAPPVAGGRLDTGFDAASRFFAPV